MLPKDQKNPPLPPRSGRRTTLRGLKARSASDDTDTIEPAFSTRPTQRDLGDIAASVPELQAAIARTTRGEYSARAARGIPANFVSGELDTSKARRPRTMSTPPPLDQVFLTAATKREITVIIKGQELTLDRRNALALATIITSTFD